MQMPPQSNYKLSTINHTVFAATAVNDVALQVLTDTGITTVAVAEIAEHHQLRLQYTQPMRLFNHYHWR